MTDMNKGAAQVGIFWVFRGTLFKAAVPVQEGLRYGDPIHSTIDHVEYWPQLQRRIKALRELEYEQVPRGLYSTGTAGGSAFIWTAGCIVRR
jgi:hypothetical protein